MKKIILLFRLSCKRFFKKPFFIFLLLFIPLPAFFTSFFPLPDSEIKAVLYIQEEDSLTQEIVADLTSRKGLYTFYTVPDEASLFHAVETGYAECGYIFTKDILEKLNDGKMRRLVRAVSSSASIVTSFINETVFAELYEAYTAHLLVHFLEQHPVSELDPKTAENEAVRIYNEHLHDGSTFSFSFASNQETEALLETPKLLLLPLRGFLSVFILLAGLTASLMCYKDKETGVFCTFSRLYQLLFKIFTILVPVFFTALSSLICLFFMNLTVGIAIEVPIMLLYILLVTIFCFLLQAVIKHSISFCAAIPFLILGSLLFSPIIIDLSEYSHFFGFISRLFLPTYYLMGF